MVKHVIHIIAWPVVAISLWYMPQVSTFLLIPFTFYDIPPVSNALVSLLVLSMLANPLLSILPYGLFVLYQSLSKRHKEKNIFHTNFWYGLGFYIITWVIVSIAWLMGISLPSWFYGNVN